MKQFTTISCWLAMLLATAVAAGGDIEFSLPDMNGRIHTLTQYEGKWIIINYWSTSCPPCLKEIPELEDFHQRHKEHDAVVLGVNFEDIKQSWLQDFIDSVTMSYPVLRSDTSPQTPFGYLQILPTTFVVSPEGRFMGRQTGTVTAAALDAYLERKRHEQADAGAGHGTGDKTAESR